jgi:uncharacterized membrane protein (UPF0127 family)
VIRRSEDRPRRFRRQPRAEIWGRRVPVALTLPARFLGLSLLDRRAAGPGLLLPGCRGVHTFGMRFPLDLIFLDLEWRPVSLRRGIPPRRFAFDRRAESVLELPSGEPRQGKA